MTKWQTPICFLPFAPLKLFHIYKIEDQERGEKRKVKQVRN